LNDPNHIRSLQARIALYEDMQAYRELYNLFFHNLHRFCFSFVKSAEAAEEIVSDVFIKLWQIRNKLSEITNLKVYLYQIAKNFCLNYITRHFKNPVASLDEMDLETVISLDNPEELCISAELINTIQQTIRQLPPQCRLIFQMVKEDGMRYKEVADILQVSVLTVRNQVAIATRKLAATLPPYIVRTGIGGMRKINGI
jgi:RNA polymerase sigma-70 factor (ECF subfamily)